MFSYFIAANVWVVVAIAIFFGRTVEQSDPMRYSVFCLDQWYEPHEFWLLMAIPLVTALVYSIAYRDSSRK